VLLVTTPGATSRGLTARLTEQIGPSRVAVYDRVTPNPSLDDLDDAAMGLRALAARAIVAVGGGSTLDTAKVLGVTMSSAMERPLAQIFRMNGVPDWTSTVPVVAVPTTSGTGAEVTPFATVWDTVSHRKHSVAGALVYPAHAVLDPELTISLPRDETLFSGLDTVSHALESLWNGNRTCVTAAYARHALTLAGRALPAALDDPTDVQERANMQNAALLAGLAISQSRTAIAHAISYPLTAWFGVPHGLACSFTLVELLRANFDVLVASSIDKETLGTILELLESFGLGERVRAYASAQGILEHQEEIQVADRLGNYVGALSDGVAGLIAKSLG